MRAVAIRRVYGRWTVKREYQRQGRAVADLAAAVREAAAYGLECKRAGEACRVTVWGGYGRALSMEV